MENRVAPDKALGARLGQIELQQGFPLFDVGELFGRECREREATAPGAQQQPVPFLLHGNLGRIRQTTADIQQLRAGTVVRPGVVKPFQRHLANHLHFEIGTGHGEAIFAHLQQHIGENRQSRTPAQRAGDKLQGA